jgi:hypothetical protein
MLPITPPSRPAAPQRCQATGHQAITKRCFLRLFSPPVPATPLGWRFVFALVSSMIIRLYDNRADKFAVAVDLSK